MEKVQCRCRVRGWTLPVLLLFALLFRPVQAGDRWHFRAVIGVDDMVQGRPGAAIFRMFVGEEKVYESPVMKPGDPPILIHIPLQKTDPLTLEVADTGDGHGGDWGNWCDARIQDDSGQTTIWLSDLKEQVLQEWITTRKDRNIVGQPLKLQGRVYLRGLGTISGSRMRYINWYRQWQEAEQQRRREEHLAAQSLRFLKLEGSLHGARLWVNEKPVSRLPVQVAPNSTVKLEISLPAGRDVFSHPVFTNVQCRSAHSVVSLRRWLPLAMQLPIPSERAALPILNGAPYLTGDMPGGKVGLTYRYPFANTASALPPDTANARYLLQVWCAVWVPDMRACPTVSVSVYEGTILRARTRLLARSGEIEDLTVPLTGKGALCIVVDDGGDGNLGDTVYVGGNLIDRTNRSDSPITDLPYLVENTPQDNVSVYHYLASDVRASVAYSSISPPRTGFRIQAPAVVVFDDYSTAVAHLHKAAGLVREAQSLLAAGKTSEAAERLAFARQLDEGNPDVYRLQAQMAETAGRANAELRAWKRLVEVSRAGLSLRRKAKERIAQLYRLLDGNRPEFEFTLPPPPPSNANIDALTQNVWRIHLKPFTPDADTQWGELRFTVPSERAGWWLQGCIDSRGLAIRVSLERKDGTGWQLAWTTEGTEPQAFPSILCQLSPGEYRLRVTHEGARDSVDGAFHVATSLLLSREKPAPPQQRWTYRLHTDGSADVGVTVGGALAVPVPFTAEEVQVEGARYSLLPPVYEYLSKLELRHAQVLLVQPTGERATVRFRWLDAAYNVPMTRYAPERKERFYFRSLAGLGKDAGEMEVTVHLPEGTGDIETLVPKPQRHEASVLHFRLPQERMVTITAGHPALNSRWLSAVYRRMTLYIPDTPFYRRWLPEYLALLMRIYDRERQIVGGYEPEDALFVSLTGPAQLSGYGGATWGGSHSETWIACTGRVGPYNLRYESGGDGVEAHELKWVFLSGVGEGLPHWLQTGAVIYIEEQGKLAGDTAFPDVWYQRSLRPGARQFRRQYTGSSTPLQWSEDEFRQQPFAQRMLGEAMANEIMQVIARRYGDRVWAELFRRNREGKLGLKDLPGRQRDARIVETLVQITGDEGIRRLFESWGFRLPSLSPAPVPPSPEGARSRSGGGR
ncbi:MAG: NPCBM/NEW2 domain-containing protein [Armatimonadota bacterium]